MKATLPSETSKEQTRTVPVLSISAAGVRIDRKRNTVLVTYEYADSQGNTSGTAQLNIKDPAKWRRFASALTTGKQFMQELDDLLLAIAIEENIIEPEAVLQPEDYDAQRIKTPPR